MSEEEFAERLKAFHKKAFYWSLSICRNNELAADILQEAYLKGYQKKDSLKDTDKFKSWLFTIIKNCAYDHFRSNKDNQLRDDYNDQLVLSVDNSELDIRKKGDQLAATHFISKLSPREQQVLELAYYQSMSVREISALLEISTGSVSTYMKRAKVALKGHILKNRHSSTEPSFEKSYTYMISKTSN